MKRASRQGREAKKPKSQLSANVMEITTATEGESIEESTSSAANDTSEEDQTVNEEPCSSKSKRNSATYSTCFQYEKIDGKQVGLCLLCKKKSNTPKYILMKNSNTTGLKKHLAAIHTCTYIEMFGSDPKKGNNNEISSLKQKRITDYEKQNIMEPDIDSFAKATVKWLAFKRLPLSFFDDEPTQTYFSQINSNLTYPKKDKMKRTLEEEFSMMSSKVKNILQNNSSKISFTVDGWTSSVGLKSYYGITCHFINDNWELQSFAISFLSSGGQHSGKDIAQTFLKSLDTYEIQNKIQGITVDNCASNTTFMVELAKIMDQHNIKFDPEMQHFRCFAHILNLGVQDILKLLKIDGTSFEESSYVSRDLDDENGEETEGHDDDNDELNTSDSEENSENKIANPIKKLRMTFLKLRRSEKLQNKLVSCCDTTNTKYCKPILDVKTRWNSTYNMINVGLTLRPALKLLFKNAEELKTYKILDDEWSMMSYINTFLRHFNTVSTALGGEKFVTLPLAVVAFNLLLDKIDILINELYLKENKTEVEQIILEAFIAGKNKLMKHYNKANWIYCVSLILDPRHKVEAFNLTTWGKEMKEYTINIFEKIFKEEYFTEDLSIDDCIIQPESFDLEAEDTLNLNALYVAHNTDTDRENGWRKEIDEYLSCKRAQVDTNILEWWRKQQHNFPLLAKMARDILAIPATSVPVERLFSQAALIIQPNRNRLLQNSIEMLLLVRAWTQANLKL